MTQKAIKFGGGKKNVEAKTAALVDLRKMFGLDDKENK
jgi:hypothetical protein